MAEGGEQGTESRFALARTARQELGSSECQEKPNGRLIKPREDGVNGRAADGAVCIQMDAGGW